jgi:hypothetical protein
MNKQSLCGAVIISLCMKRVRESEEEEASYLGDVFFPKELLKIILSVATGGKKAVVSLIPWRVLLFFLNGHFSHALAWLDEMGFNLLYAVTLGILYALADIPTRALEDFSLTKKQQ